MTCKRVKMCEMSGRASIKGAIHTPSHEITSVVFAAVTQFSPTSFLKFTDAQPSFPVALAVL